MFRSALIVGLSLILSSCLSSTEIDMKRAKKLLERKKPAEAAALYESVAKRENSRTGGAVHSAAASLEAGKIYQYDLKKFDDAIRNYRNVIAWSSDAEARRDAQVKVAGLLFYDVQDFKAAVAEYSKLISLQHTLPEEIEWRGRIARAYYYMGNYFQSGIEVDRLLTLAMGVDEEAVYQAYLLKANI
ncbi:MAG: hypothetical protein RBT63_11715, partial [Bdellovibrionales bacterium]|nr:hypothetical protein [Bdellovibrionales bacterium]